MVSIRRKFNRNNSVNRLSTASPENDSLPHTHNSQFNQIRSEVKNNSRFLETGPTGNVIVAMGREVAPSEIQDSAGFGKARKVWEEKTKRGKTPAEELKGERNPNHEVGPSLRKRTNRSKGDEYMAKNILLRELGIYSEDSESSEDEEYVAEKNVKRNGKKRAKKVMKKRSEKSA